MSRFDIDSRSKRSHWLCVAYAFPPINRSGTHRTLAFVKHLDRLGWDATVLTVEPRDEPLDSSLVAQIPVSTEVIRVPWANIIERIKTSEWVPHPLRGWGTEASPSSWVASILARMNPSPALGKDGAPAGRAVRLVGEQRHSLQHKGIREWVSRLLMTPDSRIGWIVPAVGRGLSAIRRHRPDVIYSTSPYMSAHLIALVLSRLTRLPWVADFRDPWRGNPFLASGFSSLDRWDSWLERLVLRCATHVICAAPTMTQQLHRRRPFVAGKCTTILNGYDPECFERLTPQRVVPADAFVLTHCGQFYGPRSPKIWFTALRRALERWPQLCSKVHIVLIGSETFDGRGLCDCAADAGVGDRVHVLGPRSHTETLSYMAGSDALMLATSNGVGAELQVPNKLFEYLAIRKPIIATCSSDSPVVSMLKQARAEALVCNPSDEEALAQAIAQFAGRRVPKVEAAWSGVDQFERTHRAAQLLKVFHRVLPTRRTESAHVMSSPALITVHG
jgi:glycosyltransferase involved in cell wall biosynthesis